MRRDTGGLSAWSIAGAYSLFFLLVFWPVADLLTSAWPLQFGSIQWRYGFIGLMSAYLHTPILGIALAMALAFRLGHSTAIRGLAVLSLLGGFILFFAMASFALDVIQLRSATPPESMLAFQVGAVSSELKHFTGFITISLLGVGGWRTAGRLAKRSRTAEASELTAEVLKAQRRD
jgi:hypothetical protein